MASLLVLFFTVLFHIVFVYLFLIKDPEPILVVPVVWYREEDYEKIKSISDDAYALPAAYGKWLANAEYGLQDFTTKGYTVEKVYLDPDIFLAWCRERGLNINAEARIQFAGEFIARKYLPKA